MNEEAEIKEAHDVFIGAMGDEARKAVELANEKATAAEAWERTVSEITRYMRDKSIQLGEAFEAGERIPLESKTILSPHVAYAQAFLNLTTTGREMALRAMISLPPVPAVLIKNGCTSFQAGTTDKEGRRDLYPLSWNYEPPARWCPQGKAHFQWFTRISPATLLEVRVYIKGDPARTSFQWDRENARDRRAVNITDTNLPGGLVSRFYGGDEHGEPGKRMVCFPLSGDLREYLGVSEVPYKDCAGNVLFQNI